jgi:hypothetical protein
MKKSQTALVAVILLLVIFIAGLWFQSHRLLPSSKLHEALAQKVQALTEGSLKYQSVRIGYFPQPKIVFEKAELAFSDHPLIVEAEKIQFDLNILPLLLGRAEPSAFYVQSGKTGFSLPGLDSLGLVNLENFSLQGGAVRSGIPIPFHFTSDMAGQPKTLVIKGNVILDSVEEWNWEKASGSMILELKQLSLNNAAQKGIGPSPKGALFFKGGQIDTLIEIKKKANEAFLELTATGSGTGIAYEISQDQAWIAAPVLDATWGARAAWNNDTSELKLHKASIKLPFGEVKANGSMKLNTGEIAAIHIAGLDMALEDLLKYWPGLENALPFHVGFSGSGKWMLSMEGTRDHLSLHFAWDLAKVLLSYGQYFTKPKDIPLDLTLDLLLQKDTILGGDFAIKFQEMSLKGNLKELDLRTGEGQLNLITNKFSMAGWEQYIPLLQRYKLGGDAKLMANWKGDLRKLEKAERIFNLTLDKASWTTPEGPGISNASLSLDYGPIMVEGRQMQFEIGGSSVVADLKVSGFPEQTQIFSKIASAEFKPLEAWQAVAALLQHQTEGKEPPDSYDRVTGLLQAVFPSGTALNNVAGEIQYGNGVWDIAGLQFEGYGGKADLKGTMSTQEKEPAYCLEGEFHGVDLGLFLSRHDAAHKVLEGTLHLKGAVEGSGLGSELWSQSLKGQGEWTLANGKFLTFDLKDTLSTIEPFSGLGSILPSMRDFNSMDLQWKISEGKAVTENLLVKHKDYVTDAEGNIGFDGLANFRMDVFLSSELAANLFPDMAKPFENNPQAHLGPIPMLLSGSLLTPEVKPDPAQVGELVEKIQKGKAKEILYELVME